MNKVTIFFVIFTIAACGLGAGCGNGSGEKNQPEEEKGPPPKEDYVGTYDIIETKHGRTFDVYIENDTLFFFTKDIGSSVMNPEPNEVFDVPGHETRVRFMRDKDAQIDRAIFVTKKGRWTGVKQDPDSTKVAPQTAPK